MEYEQGQDREVALNDLETWIARFWEYKVDRIPSLGLRCGSSDDFLRSSVSPDRLIFKRKVNRDLNGPAKPSTTQPGPDTVSLTAVDKPNSRYEQWTILRHREHTFPSLSGVICEFDGAASEGTAIVNISAMISGGG